MSRQLREFRRGLAELKAAPKIEPCLPSPAAKPPAGRGWLHEIKHDGFRMMIRRDAAGIRILTRNGHDWTARFPLMLTAAKAIQAKVFLIDGEAVVCDASGLAVFDRLRYRRYDASVFLYAFDLLSLNGKDLRRESIEHRKAALARLIRPHPGIRIVEHLEFDDGAMIFEHACRLGCEGIVSKRLGSRYVSGLSRELGQGEEPERASNAQGSRGRLGPLGQRSRAALKASNFEGGLTSPDVRPQVDFQRERTVDRLKSRSAGK